MTSLFDELARTLATHGVSRRDVLKTAMAVLGGTIGNGIFGVFGKQGTALAQVIGPDTDSLSPYPERVRDLIATTYLGHHTEFPDVVESETVLERFLELNSHGYLSLLTGQGQLDGELAVWQALSSAYPDNRH